jgi:hypothetical protein
MLLYIDFNTPCLYARENGVKNTAKNLKDMKDILTNLPQYQDLKAKVLIIIIQGIQVSLERV